jgi:hypothetical protein
MSTGKKEKAKAKRSNSPSTPAPDYAPKKISNTKQTFAPVSEGDESSDLRGYKKTADGRTTTYFHRELSADEKKLLGDNSPKPISSDAAAAIGSGSGKAAAGGSAWNAAGTWEEKNYSQWAKTRIKEILSSATFAVSGQTSGSVCETKLAPRRTCRL